MRRTTILNAVEVKRTTLTEAENALFFQQFIRERKDCDFFVSVL